jgi:hypothetical protein
MSDPKFHYQQKVAEYASYLETLEEIKRLFEIVGVLVTNQELLEPTYNFVNEKAIEKNVKTPIR